MEINTKMVEATAMLIFVREQHVFPQPGGPWIRQPKVVKDIYRRKALYNLATEASRRYENGKET